ncbi:hypothetical protein K490DRAFT_1647, partial [Saccharata proteae CBS 121410]
DQQATVTDFLDYTEFYPSDLVRSLALIRQLDGAYQAASHKVHELTKTYGSLPSLPEADRPDPTATRRQISAALEDAIHAREAACAEALRLHENTERHRSRLAIIKRKLQALPEPPSRDPTPPPVPVSPQSAKKNHPETVEHVNHVDHIDHVDHVENAEHVEHVEGVEEIEGVEQQSPVAVSEAMDVDEGEAPGRVKIPKTKSVKIKGPKPTPPKAPRQPGVMGTNVHSQVAGISTSNALAALTPPPPDAQPGSKWAPWHKLTEYEMAVLRKSMKKNAIWQPSDTMIRRELSQKGRGREHYERAKQHAEETGEPFLDETPMDPNKEVLDPGETSFKPIGKDEQNLINRGMKLNEMKKLKREATLREQQARGVEEGEGENTVNDGLLKSPATVNTTTTSTIPILPAGRSSSAAPSSQPPTRKGTPVPSPTSPKKPSMPSAGTRSRRTSVAPQKTSVPLPDTSSSRAPTPNPGTGIALTLNGPRRPTRAGAQSVKAASAEPPIKHEPRELRELRRGSNVSLPSPADQTTTTIGPQPESTTAAATRMSQRRGKRPAPGLVTADEDGKSKVSVGKRKKPPSKKQAGQEGGKQKAEARAGSEGIEEIDPNEPLYCLCNDVSWGTMIGCEGDDCRIEWFHISCVGLTSAPKKSVKWFCPDCRKAMH